jgi:hypothetical protein
VEQFRSAPSPVVIRWEQLRSAPSPVVMRWKQLRSASGPLRSSSVLHRYMYRRPEIPSYTPADMLLSRQHLNRRWQAKGENTPICWNLKQRKREQVSSARPSILSRVLPSEGGSVPRRTKSEDGGIDGIYPQLLLTGQAEFCFSPWLSRYGYSRMFTSPSRVLLLSMAVAVWVHSHVYQSEPCSASLSGNHSKGTPACLPDRTLICFSSWLSCIRGKRASKY